MLIIEKLFFKKRLVLASSDKLIYLPLSVNYSLIVIRNIKELRDIQDENVHSLFQKRLAKENWICFAIKETKTNILVAYYWAILGGKNTVWHDNFIIDADTALLCNAFVDIKHRNQGLYKHLIFSAHNYLLTNSIKKIYTIVEQSNKASLKANKTAGLTVHGENYLIKVLSFNILSIYFYDSKINMVLFGSKFIKKVAYKAIKT